MANFTKNQLNMFEKKLMDEKKRLLESVSRIEKTGLGDTMANSTMELSMYDNHPADIADQVLERSKDLALRDNANILIENIDTALDKIKAGTYGVCNHCGESISLERLNALPSATLCMECQEESDKIDPTPRPVEEEVLAPPFQRTFLDDGKSNFNGVGGEDALQEVMKYGSSDSPQDIITSINDDDVWPNSNDEHLIIIQDSDTMLNNHDFTEDIIDMDNHELSHENKKRKNKE